MDFINPYNFVQPQSNVSKKLFIKRNSGVIEGVSLLRGRVIVEMEALTPVITADSEVEYYSATHKLVKNGYVNVNVICSDKNIKDGDRVVYTEDKVTNTINVFPDEEKNYDIASILTGKPQDMLDIINKWEKSNHRGVFFYDNNKQPRVKSHQKSELVSHAVKRFFNFENKYIIPSDSLKGAIRNIAETFSNSCFSIFHSEEDNQLSYRQIPRKPLEGCLDTRYGRVSSELKPARASRKLENGDWEFQLFSSSPRIKISLLKKLSNNYENLIDQECQVSINKIKIITIDDIRENATSGYYKIRLDNFDYKDEYAYFYLKNGDFYCKPRNWKEKKSKIRFKKGQEYYVKFRFGAQYPELHSILYEGAKLVRENSKGNTNFTILEDIKQKRVMQYIPNLTGYIKITGRKSAENKKCERIFCEPVGDVIASKEVVEKYNDMIEEQRNICKPDNYDEHTKHGGKLKEGSLVYVKENNGQIDFITHVSIPRIWFKKGPREALENISSDLLPCFDINNLCPACELFGTVLPEKDQEKTALSGKVHFSPAFLISEPSTNTVTLSTLSSPKPTSVNFYLKPSDNNEQVVSYDSDDGPYLRGRKFYYHHQPDFSKLNLQQQTIQNSTLEYLNKGAKFRFSVDFHSLKEEELGLLLLSLLIPGKALKIGMAKPLGFGTMVNTCIELNVFDIKKHLSSLTETGELDKDMKLDKKYCKYIFSYIKSQLNSLGIDCNLLEEFKKIPYIEELLIILSKDSLDSDNIKYPQKGEGFKWFADNKDKPLKTIKDIMDGRLQKGWS